VLIIRRSDCIIQYLVSSHSVGGRPVLRLRVDSCPHVDLSPLSNCAPDGHLQSVTIPDAI